MFSFSFVVADMRHIYNEPRNNNYPLVESVKPVIKTLAFDVVPEDGHVCPSYKAKCHRIPSSTKQCLPPVRLKTDTTASNVHRGLNHFSGGAFAASFLFHATMK